MTREQAQIVRLLLVCAAWAVGQVLLFGLAGQDVAVPFGLGAIVPAALGVGVYAITGDLGRPRPGGGDGKYWRGRRIDEDRPRRDRWN